MKKSISHKFYKEENIVIITYRGDIFFDDIIKSGDAIFSDPNFLPNCNGISDFRNCNLNLSEEETQAFIEYVYSQPKAILTKWTIIADNPKSVVVGMLINLLMGKDKIVIFSTWKAATQYHGISIEDSTALTHIP